MPIHPFVEQKLPELRELCRRYHVTRLDLFGSAATGEFDPSRSDLDFAVALDRAPADGSSLSHNYFDFLRAAQSLFGLQIDTVPLPHKIENRFLRKAVEESAIPLYEA